MMYFIQKYVFLIVLLGISLLSHWYVFFDGGTLNAGDWVYHFSSTLHDLKDYHIYASAYGLGTVSVFANNWIFYYLYYALDWIKIGWDIGTRIIFLIPIIFFTPLFSFLFFKKVFQNNMIAFFSACLYSFNTFFLKLQLDWLTYAFIWWILPALFLSVLNYLDTKKEKYLIYNAVLIFLGIAYELRIMFLVLIFLSLFQVTYLIVHNDSIQQRLKYSAFIFGSIFVGAIMHIFWILPLMKGGIASDVMNNASSNPFVSLYDILDVFTLHMYSWSHNFVLEAFIKQPIELRHFLIPLLAVVGLVVYKKTQAQKEYNVYFSFFAISLVIFIFLGKQELVPLADFYGWAFRSIPLFNLYRESSKFFILVAMSSAFFFGIGLFWLYTFIQKYNRKASILIVGMLLFFSTVFNLQHFFDQGVGGMTKGTSIPDDYNILEKKLSNDAEFFRVLWTPTKPRFGFYSQNHPFVNAIDLPVIYNKRVNFTLFDKTLPVTDEIMYLFGQEFSNILLDQDSVKYVIVPLLEQRERRTSIDDSKLVDELYEYYGERSLFIQKLDKLPYLKKIDIGTKELVVYENENYRPHIYVTEEKETIQREVAFGKVSFEFKNPTEYKISLKDMSEPVYVNFSEKYHSDWKIRFGRFNWFDVLRNKNYFLSDGNHFENDAKLNSFLVNPKEVCATVESTCKKNLDGSYDIDLTLYFKPQSYFYLGLIISGATFIGCLVYLWWASRKK